MRGSIAGGCKHHYERTWTKEHEVEDVTKPIEVTSFSSSHPEFIYGTKIITWWVERCSKCKVYKGKTPWGKRYQMSREATEFFVKDNYEKWVNERTMDTLAGIGE